jgi:hypothetical protein
MTKCPKREIPGQEDVSDLETLVNLIYYKEVETIGEFTEMMKKKVIEEG